MKRPHLHTPHNAVTEHGDVRFYEGRKHAITDQGKSNDLYCRFVGFHPDEEALRTRLKASLIVSGSEAALQAALEPYKEQLDALEEEIERALCHFEACSYQTEPRWAKREMIWAVVNE